MLPRSSSAAPSYLNSLNSRYGTAGTRLDSCQVCHTSVPSRNPYGTAFGNASHNFATIENLDSDGDGYSNITEINARFFPGNAADHPATAAPVIGVTPATLPFGNVRRNSAAMLTVTVTNTGNAALSVTALTVTGSTALSLTNAPALPLNISAGSSAKVDVRYAPTNTGADSGNLAIASNDSVQPTVNIALTGAGVAPEIANITVNSLTVPFGPVCVGQSATLSINIGNTGTTNASVTALGVTGTDFALGGAAPTPPFTVAPGANIVVPVVFAASAVAARVGMLAISSTDAIHPVINVALSGAGILMSAGVTNATTVVNGVTIVLAGATNAFSGIQVGGDLAGCSWDFGDGSTSTDCSPSHVYTNCRSYIVTDSATNSFSATTTNFTVAVPCAMAVTNFQAKLNFARPHLESCQFKAVPQPTQCTNWLGTVVAVDVGGAQVSWKLDKKGRGVSTNGTCVFSYNKKTGLCTLTANLIHGSWQAPWNVHGLTSTNYPKPGVVVTLPVILLIGDDAFMADKLLHYTATAAKSGLAK